MAGPRQQVGAAVFWSVLARTLRFMLSLASSVIVVRALGQHDYGVLSVVRAILAFVVMIAGSGLRQSLLKFLPALRVSGSGTGAVGFVGRIFAIQVAVWLLFAAAIYFLSGKFEAVFQMDGIGWVLWIAVCAAIFELFFMLFSQVLNAYYDTKLLSIANVVSHAVFITGLVIMIPRGPTVLGVVLAAAAGHLLSSLLLVRKVMRLVAGPAVPAAPVSAIEGGVGVGRLVRFSLPFVAIGVLNLIVWRQSETLFLAHFRTAGETGFFDLAYRLPQTVLEFIPGTVWPIVLAGFSEVYERNRESLKGAIDKYYKMLFLLSTPICLLGVVLGGRAIPILFGEAMAPAAVPTQIFFFIFTLSFFGTPLSMSLYVMEKSHVSLLVYLVLAAVNVGLDLILIPRFGVAGAVVPVAIVIGASPFVYKRVVNHFVPGVAIPYRFIARCFLASSPVLLLWPFTGLINGVVALAAAAVVALVLVVFAFRWTKVIGKEESDLIGSIPIPVSGWLLKFVSS